MLDFFFTGLCTVKPFLYTKGAVETWKPFQTLLQERSETIWGPNNSVSLQTGKRTLKCPNTAERHDRTFGGLKCLM